MGIDRVAMLKYGIPDLRTFFEADLPMTIENDCLPHTVPPLVKEDIGRAITRVAVALKKPDPGPLVSGLAKMLLESYQRQRASQTTRDRALPLLAQKLAEMVESIA